MQSDSSNSQPTVKKPDVPEQDPLAVLLQNSGKIKWDSIYNSYINRIELGPQSALIKSTGGAQLHIWNQKCVLYEIHENTKHIFILIW